MVQWPVQWCHSGTTVGNYCNRAPGPIPRGTTTDRPCRHTTIPRVPPPRTPPRGQLRCYTQHYLGGPPGFFGIQWPRENTENSRKPPLWHHNWDTTVLPGFSVANFCISWPCFSGVFSRFAKTEKFSKIKIFPEIWQHFRKYSLISDIFVIFRKPWCSGPTFWQNRK